MKTIAIIGATGLVGKEIIKILEEKKNKIIKNVLFVATKKNVGKKIIFQNQKHQIISIEEALLKKPDFALFSAGSETALNYSKKFINAGTKIVDNSSAFRMDPKIKLIVPEINGSTITREDKIIANPNCSTTQLVMALYPIYKKHKIKRIVVSTYQAVVGTGKKALNQLKKEEKDQKVKNPAYEKKIHRNIIPQCDDFSNDGYTKEEKKIINETNKIFKSKIKITATAVRTPTIGGHGESVNVEFEKKISLKELSTLLKKQRGVVFCPNNTYVTPRDTKGNNNVFVSRLRKDHSVENGVNMWIVADPLRKGAATNTVQILESLININN